MQNIKHGETIVELTNVSFSYGDNIVLKDINLSVHKGDYLGVIGPNGGGKTTLLKLMLCLLKPNKGSIELMGVDASRFDDWPKIGYVPQKAVHFDVNFPATVMEVVLMGRYGKVGLLKRTGRADVEAAKVSLVKVGMESYSNRLIGDLSAGQQQRVFIARALASSPEILFLDEPTVGVDLKAQEGFYELLEKLNKSGITLILVSHDIDVVTNEVTELACINEELVYHGNPQKFIKDDYIEKLYGKGVKFILHGH
ncbi:MAG TPA: metal ABC transporter ATP-binding protein [Candidatus Saccharimonadales bacterium]|nr:metal ABC transporter ATP-binding protein [Candidatus Saccharimonadales bacterium]